MLLRNLGSVLAVHTIFQGAAFWLLPWTKLPSYALLSLLGVMWAVCDAVDLAGAKPGRKRAIAIWGSFAAAVIVSVWFISFPILFGKN
ncbi:MAG: hypothetical protein AB1652_11635 [Bacillota bacterium]